MIHEFSEERVGFVSDRVGLRLRSPAQQKLAHNANRRTVDDEIFQHERVEAGPDKTNKCIDRSADDRLVVEIERCVEQDRTTCQSFEGAKQSCKARVCFLVDSLYARRSVNMCDCRKLDRRLHLTGFQHVFRRMIEIEVGRSTFLQHCRCERPERLALLDNRIDPLLRFLAARIGQDRTRAQSAWSKLHPAVKPTDNFTCSQSLRDSFKQFRLATSEVFSLNSGGLDERCHFFTVERWSKIGMAEDT